MTIDEIKEIIQLLTDSGVAEIEVQRGENRVWIKRATPNDLEMTVVPKQVSQMASPAPSAGPVHISSPVLQAPQPSPEENLPVIKAPIVGTYYESPAPGSPVFVQVGETVTPGQVLCIIESMKLMNEIEAETHGVIMSKLVPNGKPVEYGEALFTYRPL